eukprot:1145664-Pelagomonas_calceolata.AAC.2
MLVASHALDALLHKPGLLRTSWYSAPSLGHIKQQLEGMAFCQVCPSKGMPKIGANDKQT